MFSAASNSRLQEHIQVQELAVGDCELLHLIFLTSAVGWISFTVFMAMPISA